MGLVLGLVECMQALLLAFLGVLPRRRDDVVVGVIDEQVEPILPANVDIVAVLPTIVHHYDLWCLLQALLLATIDLQCRV